MRLFKDTCIVLMLAILVSGCIRNVYKEVVIDESTGRPFIHNGELVFNEKKLSNTAAIADSTKGAIVSVSDSKSGSAEPAEQARRDCSGGLTSEQVSGMQATEAAAYHRRVESCELGQAFVDLVKAARDEKAPISEAVQVAQSMGGQQTSYQLRVADQTDSAASFGLKGLITVQAGKTLRNNETQQSRQIEAIAAKESIGNVTIGNIGMSTSGDSSDGGDALAGEGLGTGGAGGNTGSPESNNIIIGGGTNSVAGENGLVAAGASNAGLADDSSSAAAGLDSEFKGQFGDDQQAAQNNFDDRDAALNNQPEATDAGNDPNVSASAGVAPF